jgi:hypothetical protein
MNTYWQRLEKDGISVIAIKESPQVQIDMPACVSQHTDDPSKCTVSASKAIKPDVPTAYAAKRARGTVPVIDMNGLICTHGSCPAIVGNVLVYQDNHHLTSTYALTTAPYLEQRLLAASKALAAAH